MIGTITIASPDSKYFSNILTTENRIMDRVEYPQEGGCLIWFKGHPYPDEGFITPNIINLVDAIKRLLVGLLKLNWRIIFLISRKELLAEYCNHILIRRIAYAQEHKNKYCQSVREILRVGKKLELDMRLMETFGLIVEYDNAYKARFLDLCSVLDKGKFFINPVREVLRVCKVAENRENNADIKIKWNTFRLGAYLLLLPKIRKIARKIVAEIDLNQMKLDSNLLYWNLAIPNYNYLGLSLEERLKRRNVLILAKTL